MNHDRSISPEFINQLRDDFWQFGNLAWLIAIADRTLNSFADGLLSATDIAQLFTIGFLAVCWLVLNPSPADEEALYNTLKTFIPKSALPEIKGAVPSVREQIQRYGYQQSSLWRGWKIHHAVMPNARSQVPIILVHGFGGSIGHWRQNISELAKHHSVYTIDLLGFGASDKPDIAYSIDLWVEQLHEFWQTFIGTPVILVGNSIGSLTCLAAAADYPEMVRGVAMISLPDTASHEAAIPVRLRPLVSWLQAIFVSPIVLYPLFHILKHPAITRRWASIAYACREAVTDELLEILTKPTRERGSAQAFCAILKGMISPQFSPSVQSILTRVKIPSLLLWGKHDRMIPAASAHQFLSYNSALQLIELDEAGHCAHDECPERVNAELIEWIQTQVLQHDRGRSVWGDHRQN